MLSLRNAAACVVVCALGVCAYADDVTVYGSHADHDIIAGGRLSDVRLAVGLSVKNSVAVMTFTNASTGLETSAIFKEIVLDTFDSDNDNAIVWNPVVLDGSFDIGDSNGLPGYNAVTRESPVALLEFSPVKKGKEKNRGLEIGQSVSIQFQTNLADGADMQDYFAAFGGGTDRAGYSIGFHAISATTVNGESLSGIYTANEAPEPTTITLLAFGGALQLRRRRMRQS